MSCSQVDLSHGVRQVIAISVFILFLLVASQAGAQPADPAPPSLLPSEQLITDYNAEEDLAAEFADPLEPEDEIPIADDTLEILDLDGNVPVTLNPADAAADFTAPEALKYTERAEEDLLIVEVIANKKYLLDRGIDVYADEEGLVLPLGLMAKLMEFKIDVNPATGVVKGWFLNQDNTLEMSAPYDHMTLAGERIPIDPLQVENHRSDIFVTQALFEKIFSVKANLNMNQLRLYLETDESLPFEQLAERRSRWEAAKRQSERQAKDYDPKDVVHLPYRKYAPPEITLSHGVNGTRSAGATNINTTHSIQTQGDLLGMNLQASGGYATSTSGANDFQNTNITFSKEDYQGNLLGPLKATRYSFGDVSGASIPLVNGAGRGRGFAVSNAPVSYVSNAADFVIEGFGPVGYDVEVYQNERLLDFQTIGTDGRYSFPTLDLNNGFNLFRIILYGPNGQTEERQERFYLGQNMVEEGQFIYGFSALESSSPLLDLKKSPSAHTDPTFSAAGEYGINEYLSANAGLFHGPLGASNISGLNLGARVSGRLLYSSFNAFQTTGGAQSLSASATGNLSSTATWNAAYTRHSGYTSDERNIIQETFLGLTKKFMFDLLPNSSVSIDTKTQEEVSGLRTNTTTNRISTQILGLSLNNKLEFIQKNNAIRDELLGELTLRHRMPFGLARARLNYHLKQEKEINGVDIQFQSDLSPNLTLNSSLESTFSPLPENTLSVGLGWQREKYRLGISASASDQDRYQVGTTLAYNFVPQTLKGDYEMSGDTRVLGTGKLMLVAFLDSNRNGTLDEGEKTLEGVKFKNVLRNEAAVSDEEGQATLSGLVPNKVNRIYIDESTLPDIFMTPQKPELLVMGKKGINGPVLYPLDPLGEISGIVYGADLETGILTPVEGLLVYLLDEKGGIAAESTTEFDGYYSFPSVRLGSYRIHFPDATPLAPYHDGDSIDGPSFTLTQNAPEMVDEDIIVRPGQVFFKDEAAGAPPNVEETAPAAHPPPEANLKRKEESMTARAPMGFMSMKLADLVSDSLR